MGRSLPWTKPQAQIAPSRSSKARAQLPVPQQAAAPRGTATATADSDHPNKHRRVKREGIFMMSNMTVPSDSQKRPERTPSTSPPPAPPSEEFMREGFDHDDIYMMVEDEFYSIAQSFTQHLHHAEYVRLKNIAKAKVRSNLSSESRPTDSITKMREELKRQKQAEAQAGKNKQALSKLGGEAARKRIKLSAEEDAESEAEEDDMWAGTTLKGLMTSPSKTKTSLMGLHGHKSNTRAAAGYSPPKAPDSKPGVAFNLSNDYSKTRDEGSQATASEDDDDLDGPVRKPLDPHALKSIERDVSSQLASKATAISTKSKNSYQPSQRLLSGAYDYMHNAVSSSPSESETDDRPALSRLAVSRLSRPLKRRSGTKLGMEDAKVGAKAQPNVNEIPIFLV